MHIVFPILIAAFLFLFQEGRAAPEVADSHAVEQLSLFAKSRPGVEMIINSEQKLYRFLVEAFSGTYTSVPLAWDNREPNDNAYAEHKPNVKKKFINIRVSSKLSPPDQVACMVYEAINAQNEEQFAKLTENAHNGLLTKTEFIHSILRLEHKSLKRTRAFLSQQEPFKNLDLSTTIFYSKMNGTPKEFNAFLAYLHTIKRKDYDVFKHYSDFYDFVIPPTKRWKAEHRALAAGTPETGSEEKKEKDRDEKPR